MMPTRPIVRTATTLAALFGAAPVFADDVVRTRAAVPPPIVVPWSGLSGEGLSIGYENGLLGQGLGQGLRLRVPFTPHWGVGARLLSVLDAPSDRARWSVGGRLELFGQTDVFLNLVRLYGGGGAQLFRNIQGGGPARNRVGGGGQFGFEFFMSRGRSFFLEVGGSGASPQTTGASVVAGLNVYPAR